MSISSKIHQWKADGIIDAATAERIETFEHSTGRPAILYALSGLGALTIGIGIVSVVAANWDGIGASLKLAVDLLLALALAASTFEMARRERRWPTDLLVIVSYLFCLASLALIGQIYESGTPIHEALLVWSAATLPLMLLGRSQVLGLAWCLGLALTEGTWLHAWLDHLEKGGSADKTTLLNVAISGAFVSPLAFVVAGHLLALRDQRDEVSTAFRNFGWLCALFVGLTVPFAWYDRVTAHDEPPTWSLVICSVAGLAFIATLRRLYPHIRLSVWCALAAFFAIVVATLAATFMFERTAWPALGALTQTLMLAVLALVATQEGWVRTFNALTALVALRILVMYFEVFGSMLSTGLGMIGGGTLTLLLAWLWRHRSVVLARRPAKVED